MMLPEVTVARMPRKTEPLVDYSKSIILTSDNYIALMEEKYARKEALDKAKVEKKQDELDKKWQEEEKLREHEDKCA